MKKLFFIGCFVFLWSHSFPQRNELFQIWKTAAEDVNKYDYRPKYEVLDPDSYHFHTYDLQETLHTTYSRLTDSDYKKLARSLIKKGGFDFDRQNDTLMFLFNFYLSVNVPGVVIAKSSCSEKVYFVKFRELFLKYGYYDGKEVVLRIVLKNGKVVLPSYLWIYPAIRRELLDQ